MNIIINYEPHTVDQTKISHEEVCKLAGEPDYATVTYRGPRHGDSQRSGVTHVGLSVELEEGMRFTAIVTGNA